MRISVVAALAALAAALGAACDHASGGASGHVDLVAAPPAGDVAPWVADQLRAAPGRDVIVYVGATWCEPCQHFHDAVTAGQLDARFPRLRLLEFDLDRDGDRLEAAGYDSEYIPLWALPAADGRAAGPHIEGSIKGDGAVAEITPRLAGLLGH